MQKDLEARGLSVIGVSYDDTADLVREFQRDIKQDYAIVLGGKDVGSQLPASPLPTTYIIARNLLAKEPVRRLKPSSNLSSTKPRQPPKAEIDVLE